jgi:hypothetical protein
LSSINDQFGKNQKPGDSRFLRASEEGTVVELLSEISAYSRMHGCNAFMERGSRQMTSAMQNAILEVVKASLDRRRRTNRGPMTLNFPD